MPELPEVETIVRDLNKVVVGRKIKSVSIRYKKQFRGDPQKIIGAKLKSVERVGKMIVMHMGPSTTLRVNSKSSDSVDSYDLIIHLKMTGQLIFIDDAYKNQTINSKQKTQNPKEIIVGGHPDGAYSTLPPHKYTHITLEFTDGSHLFFNDLRRFGWMAVLSHDKTELKTKNEKLKTKVKSQKLIEFPTGIDGLSKDLTSEYLSNVCNKRQTTIKQLLMDQSIIAGIGNIYSDEILFCAGIDPRNKSNQLDKNQIQKIVHCIPEILNRSIKAGGTSRSDYRKLDGSKGGYMDIAWVYGRENKPCRKCQTPIKRIKIGQRSSHYCPKCQKNVL